MENRLKEFREKAGLSQRQLAKLLNPKSPNAGHLTILNAEHKRTSPRMGTALKLAKALNVPFDELWAIEENLNEIS